MTKNILIVGATSRIAEHVARIYAANGDRLFLVARDAEKLELLSNDLKVRGAESVATATLDVNEMERHDEVIQSAFSWHEPIHIALFAHGTLPDQEQCEKDIEYGVSEITTNAISTISLVSLTANRFEKQKQGVIAVITSVAGDRGRQSNYFYGSAKGMISLFLQGLRNRLFQSGVKVLDCKPGFVDTPMTKDFQKGLLWAKPETVASGIVRGIEKGGYVKYLPWFWKYIMMIIKNIPEAVFVRMKL